MRLDFAGPMPRVGGYVAGAEGISYLVFRGTGFGVDGLQFEPLAVPEPGVAGLLAFGLTGVAGLARVARLTGLAGPAGPAGLRTLARRGA